MNKQYIFIDELYNLFSFESRLKKSIILKNNEERNMKSKHQNTDSHLIIYVTVMLKKFSDHYKTMYILNINFKLEEIYFIRVILKAIRLAICFTFKKNLQEICEKYIYLTLTIQKKINFTHHPDSNSNVFRNTDFNFDFARKRNLMNHFTNH